MTLITHLKTKHFNIIMGDGMITTGHSSVMDAQKVYHTNDENYLIGYCGDLSYRKDTTDNTPKILESIMPKTFGDIINLQESVVEAISESLGCNYGEILTIEFITLGDDQSEIVKHIKSRASFAEIKNDEQKAMNQYSTETKVSTVNKNFLSVEGFSYLPSRYNNDKKFTKAFEDAYTEKDIDVNEETDKEKLFDLLKYLYFNKIYPIVDKEKGIGGKITIIIKPLDGSPIEQRDFSPN